MSGHIVQGSLGYFINPLVTILLGVLVLGEKLRTGQWVAIGFAAVAVIVLIVGWGAVYFLGEKFTTSQRNSAAATAEKSGGIDWQPFSQKALDALLAEGKPVFLDFTADWCISCKFNERTAIDVPAVRAAFQKNGIVPLKADWTNANPEITAALKKFGRVGVPFYVIYPAGRPTEPITLPEILTEQIVLDALARSGS